jgi:cyclic dehypoxanthinyl futalosine synthase
VTLALPLPTIQPMATTNIKGSSVLGRELNIEAVIAGEARLSAADAVRLYHEASMHDLGRWASAVCDRIHAPAPGSPDSPGTAPGSDTLVSGGAAGGPIRTYVIDRNVNYTNVCSARCTFCAFRRDDGEADAYTLSTEQLHHKIQELVDIGGTQVLLQGGMHPDLQIGFYEDMLAGIKTKFPGVHVHGFSPPEFVEFVAVFELDGFPTTAPGKSHELPKEVWDAKLDAILKRLVAAGLDTIPGGGGEIFPEHVRRRIGIGKATAKEWLDVMAAGHRLGMLTSATMMFGHIEGIADRIMHMAAIRERQDEAIRGNWPGRYVSFISWPFQRENTPLGRVPDYDMTSGESLPGAFPGDVLADKVFAGELDPDDKAACDKAVPGIRGAGKLVRMAGASEYLRMQAISRLFLDNIRSIGASWVTMGPKIGQLGLFYGANDMGSVMMEENVVSAAGTTYCLNEPVLCQLIRDSGFTPAQRDNSYNLLKVHDGPDAPDLQVTDWSEHRVQKLHIEKGGKAEPGISPGDEGATVPLTIGT